MRSLLLTLDALSKQETEFSKPKDDDELHHWIKENLGVDIPRVSVCVDHDAPFDVISDLFFDRVQSAIVVANRGGGKTESAALWQFLNMRFIPEVACISVGAQDIQAKRAYSYFKNFQRRAAPDKIDTSLISETVWKGGEKYEILTGSKSSVNGPHVPKVHRDEVERMEKEVYQESLGIEATKTISDGTKITTQSLITSTRKTSDGLMQGLLDECKEAEKEGRKPPHKIYVFCIKEVIETQSKCRVAYPDLPEEEKCDCNLVKNGEFGEGEDRTLDKICDGLFAKSAGFKPLSDIQKTFSATSKAMWDAQYECKRPYTEDITLEEFSREKHCVRNFPFDYENGPVFMGIDIGGTVPHAVEWGQLLDYDVEVTAYNNKTKIVPQDSLIYFNEIYRAEIGDDELADMICEIERNYRMDNPRFRVKGRFVDPQAKLSRLNFKRHDPPLHCIWPVVSRDREDHLKRFRTKLNEGRLYVDVENCPMLVEEIESWNIEIKKFDHAVDSSLYLSSNLTALQESGRTHFKGYAAPGSRSIKRETMPEIRELPTVRYSGPEKKMWEEDQEWRNNLYKGVG